MWSMFWCRLKLGGALEDKTVVMKQTRLMASYQSHDLSHDLPSV